MGAGGEEVKERAEGLRKLKGLRMSGTGITFAWMVMKQGTVTRKADVAIWYFRLTLAASAKGPGQDESGSSQAGPPLQQAWTMSLTAARQAPTA